MIKLTPNAVGSMQDNSAGHAQHYVVLVSNLKVMQDCMRMDVSDGTQKTKAILFISDINMDVRKVGKPHPEDGMYIIQINQYTTYTQKDKIYIQILRFTPVQPPKSRSDLSAHTVSVKKQVKLEQREPKTEKKSEPKSAQIQRIKIQEKTQRQESSYKSLQKQQNGPADDDDLKRFQKIADLYPDLPGWEIIVRVIDKSYREFNNKSGKFTKIFSMTLIDRAGISIEAAMFGDNAKQYHDLIKTNGVYRMSKGQIREDNYNQKKKEEKFSRYTINFTKNSVFIPVMDIPYIPRATTSYVQLPELIRENNFENKFDVVGILLSIGDERIIEKDGKSLFKRSLFVGDPENRRSIEVVVWNKDLVIDPRWVDRTIVLKSFKLHTFRDMLTINSFFKSQIRLEPNHRYSKFQGKYQERDYEPVSQLKENNDKNNQPKQKGPKSIRDLQNQLNTLNSNQTIYSDLQVYITHMSFKGKWFYEACNNSKCKKSTESQTKCLNCGHYNDATHKRFILPIQISDFTGSLWTTAFDELAQELFKGIPIDQLTRLTENQLREQAQKRLYQQYKIKLSTKKQSQGNAKHNIVGKVFESSAEKTVVSNVQKIKKILDY